MAFPYSPTRILSSAASKDLVYIFQPSTSSAGDAQLLTLNASRTLSTSNLPSTIISPALPFLSGANNQAYTPAIDGQGNILVYTGDCRNTTQGSTLWQFAPADRSLTGNGTWEKLGLSLISAENGLNEANYLASAIAFSTTANATAGMYVFGGMCPNSTASTASDWIQGANYSNSMLTIQPAQLAQSSSSYELGLSSSRGPPIAEAGFTITPLEPTFFNSGDNNTQSQNQNFVLLGGQTQQAFINMSQVALFSLPEQSWTFLPVDSPPDTPSTDLAARGKTTVDSRSGHTALLTSDGKRVIVFGGWVGDVNTSADPQLAVLELGEGYGGNGDWQWVLPAQVGTGLATGAGVYGHGAVMLEGDVMMVIGGYQIPAAGSSKRKRAAPLTNSDTYFFNTTSNSWLTTYTHPKLNNGGGTSTGANTNADQTAKRAGLGVGLTLGILALFIIAGVYFCYSRRLKRRRDAREEELRNLAAGAQRFHLSGPGQSGAPGQMSEVSTKDGTEHNRQGWNGAFPWNTGNKAQHLNRPSRMESDAERTGMLLEIPSPTRGLRRSLHSRGAYQPAPRYDDGRRGPGFSTIHPIDERDEYDEGAADASNSGDHEMIQRRDFNLLSNVPVLDPFRDPVDGSRSPSPQSPRERELEIQNWVNDWTKADALMHHQPGRLSPEKTDRTSSTLSEQSARSMISSSSVQNSVGTVSRTISQRSAALFSSTPFRSVQDSTQHEKSQDSNTPRRYSPEHRRSQSLTLYPSPQRTPVSDAFANPTTSIPQPQSEGEALLGDYTSSREPSPTRPQSRARGWMGSVRRAFTGTDRSASASPEHSASTSSSPTKWHHTDAGLPRRAASTGAMLWQKRQGAKDWDVENGKGYGGTGSASKLEGEDEEWDVESAVERRVVQVMFTVPRERLRVVNRGPDGDGDSIKSAEFKEATEGDEAEGTRENTEKG